MKGWERSKELPNVTLKYVEWLHDIPEALYLTASSVITIDYSLSKISNANHRKTAQRAIFRVLLNSDQIIVLFESR